MICQFGHLHGQYRHQGKLCRMVIRMIIGMVQKEIRMKIIAFRMVIIFSWKVYNQEMVVKMGIMSVMLVRINIMVIMMVRAVFIMVML